MASGFFNAGADNQPSYTAEDFNLLLNGLFSDGILRFSGTSFTANDALKVSNYEGSAILIQKGAALIEGAWYITSTDEVMELGASSTNKYYCYIHYIPDGGESGTGSIEFEVSETAIDDDNYILPIAEISMSGSNISSVIDKRSKWSTVKSNVVKDITPSVSVNNVPFVNYTHNLNKYPAVVCVDSNKNIVYGNVEYVNANQVSIVFSENFTGTIYFN